MRLISSKALKFHKIELFIYGDPDLSSLQIINGNTRINYKSVDVKGNCIYVYLESDIDIKYTTNVFLNESSVNTFYGELFKTSEFNDRFFFSGELGAIYSSTHTLFRLWSPAAQFAELLIYKNGDPSVLEIPRTFQMQEKNGLWSVNIPENLKNHFYNYKVKVYDTVHETSDPYARASGINGLRSAVINLDDSNPEGWYEDQSPELKNYTDSIIYEVSIRDISSHPESGVMHKGKFLALTHDESKTSRGESTCLDHLLELGVTHIQLMPIYDFNFKSVDEKNVTEKYNWGYDPQNYNIPEGGFSTNPFEPLSRIKELKRMIAHLHKRGLSVNMDVVYNHVYEANESNFEKIFPGYYFRKNIDGSLVNGSGCGNDTASENKMMQKFIIDSVLYWANEFHIDGFRFDLMGLHDIDTMNLLRKHLTNLSRPIMLYGEGWDIPTGIGSHNRATQYNSYQLPEIGFFNDTIRDAIRGGVFDKREKGFVSGRPDLESKIMLCVSGCIDYNIELKGLYSSPAQSINYVSSHDDNTLWDKLEACAGEFSHEEKKSMQKLANGIVLTSQGIPFLHSGVEFCRTKRGIENSYKSPDNINWIDWESKHYFKDVFDYYKGIIKIRREHPSLRMVSSDQIRRNLKFLYNTPKNTVAFVVDGREYNDTWKNIFVAYNANNYNVTIPLPEGTWNIAATKYSIQKESSLGVIKDSIQLESICMYILYNY